MVWGCGGEFLQWFDRSNGTKRTTELCVHRGNGVNQVQTLARDKLSMHVGCSQNYELLLGTCYITAPNI